MVCVNLLDEAKKKRIHVNLVALSTKLGVPVEGIVARSGKNIDHLIKQISQAAMRQKATTCDAIVISEDTAIASIKRAQTLYHECVTLEQHDVNAYDRRLDRIVTSKAFGFPIMILLLALVF